jgi:hypothetical protein
MEPIPKPRQGQPVTTDHLRVAIGSNSPLPRVLVDLQSYFEFSFELDELLKSLASGSSGQLRETVLPPWPGSLRILHPPKC